MFINVRKSPAKRLFVAFCLTFIGLAASVPAALAQVTVPQTAEGGRFDQPLLTRPIEPLSTGLPIVASDDDVSDIEEIDLTFTFNGIIVEDATVLSQEDFEPLYADQLGQDVTVDFVFELAQRATALYRREGYILSQVIIPPQEIDGGPIRLQAIEGFVDEVIIEGEVGSQRTLVSDIMSQITQERPLHIETLEHYLLLAGDLAGLEVRSVFSPSEETIGAATLTVQVTYSRFEGAFEVTNHGSNFVGPLRTMGEVYFNSLLGFHERLGLRIAAAGDGQELLFGELSGSVPLAAYGTSLFGQISISDSQPGGSLRAFDVANDSLRWSIGLSHPIIRSRDQNLFVRVQFDWDDLQSDTNLGLVTDDHLRTLRASLDYDFVDTAFGARFAAVTAVRVEARQGLGILGATSSSDPNRSRLNADGTYTAFTAEIQRYQSLGVPGLTLLAAASGQISSGALLSSAEFGFGGNAYGRGYDPSTLIGDRGIAGKLELQYQSHWPGMSGYLDSYQLFTFLDVGIVQNVDVAGVNGSVTEEVHSIGGGLRLDFASDFEAEFGLAWLSDTINNDYAFADGEWRALFRLAKRF